MVEQCGGRRGVITFQKLECFGRILLFTWIVKYKILLRDYLQESFYRAAKHFVSLHTDQRFC
jgi:hypothetical protein